MTEEHQRLTVAEITSPDDPRIAIYRNVADPTLLREHDLFMAESREVVRLLLTETALQPESLLLTAAGLKALAPVLCARSEPPPIYLAAAGIIDGIVGFRLHRGCLAACRQFFASSAVNRKNTRGPGSLLGDSVEF